jgi:hypothetical protein
MLRRFTGKSLCDSCEAQRKRARQAAAQEYRSLLADLTAAPDRVAELEPMLRPAAQGAELPGEELTRLNQGAFEAYLERALEDDYLTVDEEATMNNLAGALDISQSTFESRFAAWMPRLLVARCNDGRLLSIASPHIVLKKSEVAYMETSAALMKKVVHREYRGGYSGVSFRVMKGVRFHTGGTRGKSVVTGTSLQVSDTGLLTVTSQRAVYTGARQSIEMPYAKLLSLNVFNDGIQFHLSNRKNPPLFRLEAGLGNAVAATINAAAQ